MSTVKVIDVADWFIARANREKQESFGEGITNLKLQKLLYFSQAARLALDNQPLFNEEIYAWNYGPVVPEAYRLYKQAEKRPISQPSTDGYQELSEEVTTFLEEVWELFGKYSAGKLVEMSHSHTPWKNIYDGTRDKIISKESMRQYYQGVFIRT